VNSSPSFFFDKVGDETFSYEFLADFKTGRKLEKGGATPGPAPGDPSSFLQACKVINNPCRNILHKQYELTNWHLKHRRLIYRRHSSIS
jgi:hypothetical protein